MSTRRRPAKPKRRAVQDWEQPHDSDVDELRVARYRLLIQSGHYHRSARDLAQRILERDLQHLPPWSKRFDHA